MSRESSVWLNTMTLIGQVLKRGTAWHYRKQDQGTESNHYDGAIPVEDVIRRLFGWTPEEGTSESRTPSGLHIVDADRKSIVRPPGALGPNDKGAILFQPKSGYKIHGYTEWLIRNAEVIASQGLPIGSAGLLKQGAQAWVSFEVPDTITTPEGVAFRPNLLAATSLDGTLATTYQRVVTNVVCDNTMSAALSETGQRVKVKHSKNSLTKISEVRDALAIVHSIADDFSAEVATLCNTTVTDAQFDAFLASIAPIPEEDGRGRTMAENRQGEFRKLWNSDPRVTPWKGTAFGVVQAANTYEHHLKAVRGGGTDEDAKRFVRAERNMDRAVRGDADALDTATLATLTRVLQPA